METLFTILFAAFGVLVVISILGTIVWRLLRLRHVIHGRNGAARLAPQLDFQCLTPGRPPQQSWYGGMSQGRRVAFGVSKSASTAVTYGYRHRLNLTLVLEVRPRLPFSGSAHHSERTGAAPNRFEEAFEVHGQMPLSPAARTQMLAFVAKGHGAGVQGFIPQPFATTRNLVVRGQAGNTTPFPDPVVLPDSKAIVVHDHPTPELSAEECRRLFYEMAVVAYAIEQGQ